MLITAMFIIPPVFSSMGVQPLPLRYRQQDLLSHVCNKALAIVPRFPGSGKRLSWQAHRLFGVHPPAFLRFACPRLVLARRSGMGLFWA
jgi:hypothetical protein